MNVEFNDAKIKHDERIQKLGFYKARTMDFINWIKTNPNQNQFYDLLSGGVFNKLSNMSECHSYLLFRQYLETGVTKLHDARHCDLHLLCPLCAIRRASRKYKIYVDKTKELMKTNPKLKLYYLVLTVKNGEDLQERYDHLNNSCKKLVRRRRDAIDYKKGKKSNKYAIKSMFGNIIAGAYSYEFKRGENSGLQHPHGNFLLLTNKTINFKDAINEWTEITKDSKILHFDLIKHDSIEKSFLEIFKYALKFSDMSFEDNFLAYQTLKGRRLLGSFGDFRGLDITAEEDGTDENLGDFIELLYRFNGEVYKKSKI